MRRDCVQDPPYDDKSFARIVTQDASPEGGAPAACAPNMRRGWKTLFSKGADAAGRLEVSEAMQLCPRARLESEDDVQLLAQWLQGAWDYLAMVRRGNPARAPSPKAQRATLHESLKGCECTAFFRTVKFSKSYSTLQKPKLY